MTINGTLLEWLKLPFQLAWIYLRTQALVSYCRIRTWLAVQRIRIDTWLAVRRIYKSQTMSKHAVENMSGEGCVNEPARSVMSEHGPQLIPDFRELREERLQAAARRACEAYFVSNGLTLYAVEWESMDERVKAHWLAVARAVLSGE